jgi:hypothetical protein
MFTPPRHSPWKAVMQAALISIQASCVLNAQSFTTRSANFDPFGVNGPLPFGEALDLGDSIAFKGGFGYGIGIQSIYDSNFFKTEDNEESEFSTNLLPTIYYTTDPEGGARVAISASYHPVIRLNSNNSEFNRIDQSGNVSIIVAGARTTISAYAGYSQESGTDQLAGGYVTGTAINLGIRGSYQLAPRTSIYAGWATSVSDYDENSAEGFDGYNVNFGGFWAATERLSFGPNISFSTSSSDTTGTRDAFGIAIQATYAASERIRLAGSLGVEHSKNTDDFDSGGVSLTGSLNASYQINELWSWRVAIQSGVVPSPIQTNYMINNWSASSILTRKLVIGSLGFGMDYNHSIYDRVGPARATPENEDTLGFLLTYQRTFFLDRVGFDTSLHYSINDGANEWSQLQLSAGLRMEF